MKLIITSDWHIDEHPNHPNLKTHIIQAIKQVYCIAASKDIDVVCFGGDLVHKNNDVSVHIATEVHKLFNYIHTVHPSILTLGVSGNHGLGELSTIQNSPTLQSWSRLLDLTHTNFTCLDGKAIKVSSDTEVYGIQYFKYKEDFDKALDLTYKAASTSPTKNKVLLIHQTPRYEGMKFKSEVDPYDSRFTPFNHVYCGHIHKRLDITTNFSLIGTLVQLSFKEGGKDINNGFLIYDTDTGTHEFISLDFPKFIETDTPLDNTTDYVRVTPKFTTTLTNQIKVDFAGSKREPILASYLDLNKLPEHTQQLGFKILAEIKG